MQIFHIWQKARDQSFSVNFFRVLPCIFYSALLVCILQSVEKWHHMVTVLKTLKTILLMHLNYRPSLIFFFNLNIYLIFLQKIPLFIILWLKALGFLFVFLNLFNNLKPLSQQRNNLAHVTTVIRRTGIYTQDPMPVLWN